jgi:hypothetical protein
VRRQARIWAFHIRWFSVVRRTVTTEEIGGSEARIEEEDELDICHSSSDTM